jgi:sulfofructose kinase
VIVCCGYLNLDLSVRVPALPEDGARLQATAIERQPGGMAANAASAAAAFGAPVQFVGAVGDDLEGQLLVDDLTARGIEAQAVARDRFTTICLVLVTPNGQRAIISQDDALTAADMAYAYDLAAAASGVLYLDGYRWPVAAEVLPGRDHARPIVVTDLDGCETLEGLLAAGEIADHVVCSRSHLARLVAPRSPEQVVKELVDRFGTVVVLTDGAHGWWALEPAGEHRGSGIPVDVVDTTGAGDAFCGAYVAELLRGAEVQGAARLANAAAALSTTGPGARSALADRRKAEALLADQADL